MSPLQWALTALQKYAVFSGRSRRREYWWFVLFNTLALLLAFIAGASVGSLIGAPGAVARFAFESVFIALFLPSLGVAVRRLHDTGRSGWWYLIVFVPLAGPIVLLVFTCQDSQPGPNTWGNNPKELELVNVRASAFVG